MTLPIYPGSDLLPGLAYSSKWSPRFFNHNAVTVTGAEIDVAVAQYPLHDFELTYRFLRDGPNWRSALAALELRTMVGFFLQLAGSQGRFLFRNPADWNVFQNPIGTGDGTTAAFTLTRTYGANGYTGTEPVGQVDTAAGINVYLAGSSTPEDPASYTVSTATPVANTITFDTPPAAGAAIAVDMQYRYYCKLTDDQMSFEKFMSQIWSLNRITLRSCRAGA